MNMATDTERSAFLSTPSARRATTRCKRLEITQEEFLSTPSARRATTAEKQLNIAMNISIHALREEGDGILYAAETAKSNFYPRPPRGGRLDVEYREVAEEYFYPRPPRGGRPSKSSAVTPQFAFLSTPSARRATL